MPSKSKKQARLMNAAAHNPKFAKKVGIKKKVAEDFVASGPQYSALPERVPQKKKGGK